MADSKSFSQNIFNTHIHQYFFPFHLLPLKISFGILNSSTYHAPALKKYKNIKWTVEIMSALNRAFCPTEMRKYFSLVEFPGLYFFKC